MTTEELEKRIEALETDLAKANEDKKAALGEKFKLAKDLKEAQAAAVEAAESAGNANSTELEKAIKRAEKAERELVAANDRATKSDKGLREYKRDAAISAAIASANVDAQHVALLTKALTGDVEFDDAGEPTIEGKAISAYTKSFFAKEGLAYVRPAENNGGGATGGSMSKALRLNKDNFNMTAFAKIQLDDPEEANAIADAVGRPELKTRI